MVHEIGRSRRHLRYINLAMCYEYGKGVKKDIPEALKLYGKAAEKGHAKAKENLRRLIDEMR